MSRTICYDAKDMEAALREAEKYGVDTERFRPERITTNSWTNITKEGEPVEHGQVKVLWEEVIKQESADSLKELASRLIKPTKIPNPKNTGKNFAVVSLADFHFGSLSWHNETGKDYDMNIAKKLYMEAVANLCQSLEMYNVDEVIFPAANDFLNIDCNDNTTTHGTKQDVDGRYPKIIKDGTELFIRAIEVLAQKYKVFIPYIRSNHDQYSSLTTIIAAECYFKDCKHITVDADNIEKRIYIRRGNNIIGMDHGDTVKVEKIPTLFASEVDCWNDCPHKYFYRGHIHHKRSYWTMASNTVGGVELHTLPSLKPADKWHADNGFVDAPQMATAHIFDYKRGRIAETVFKIQEHK